MAHTTLQSIVIMKSLVFVLFVLVSLAMKLIAAAEFSSQDTLEESRNMKKSLFERSNGLTCASSTCQWCQVNCCKASKTLSAKCHSCEPSCCSCCKPTLTVLKSQTIRKTSCGSLKPSSTFTNVIIQTLTSTNVLIEERTSTYSSTDTVIVTETAIDFTRPPALVVTVTSTAPARTITLETLITSGTITETSYINSFVLPSTQVSVITSVLALLKTSLTTKTMQVLETQTRTRTRTLTYATAIIGLPVMGRIEDEVVSFEPVFSTITNIVGGFTTTLSLLRPTTRTVIFIGPCIPLTSTSTVVVTYGSLSTKIVGTITKTQTTISTSTKTLVQTSTNPCPLKLAVRSLAALSTVPMCSVKPNPECKWCLQNCCRSKRVKVRHWRDCGFCQLQGCCNIQYTTKTVFKTLKTCTSVAPIFTTQITQLATERVDSTLTIYSSISHVTRTTSTLINRVSVVPPWILLPSEVVIVETPTLTLTTTYVTNGVTTFETSIESEFPVTKTSLSTYLSYSTITQQVTQYAYSTDVRFVTAETTTRVIPTAVLSRLKGDQVNVVGYSTSPVTLTRTFSGMTIVQTFDVITPTGTSLSTEFHICTKIFSRTRSITTEIVYDITETHYQTVLSTLTQLTTSVVWNPPTSCKATRTSSFARTSTSIATSSSKKSTSSRTTSLVRFEEYVIR
jgi:hypothetical protein